MLAKARRSQKDHDHTRGQSSSRVIDYLKLFGGFIVGVGGLITVMAGLLEYASHNEQERTSNIFNAMQLVQQGSGTLALRENILRLITPLYDPNYYKGAVVDDLYGDSGKAKNFILNDLFKTDLLRFKNVLSFLETMHEYGLTDACAWKMISVTYSRDASTILYYFWPVLYDEKFAKEQNINPQYLREIESKQPPVPFDLPCETHSFLQDIKKWIR